LATFAFFQKKNIHFKYLSFYLLQATKKEDRGKDQGSQLTTTAASENQENLRYNGDHSTPMQNNNQLLELGIFCLTIGASQNSQLKIGIILFTRKGKGKGMLTDICDVRTCDLPKLTAENLSVVIVWHGNG
jgi:hypothetical protein